MAIVAIILVIRFFFSTKKFICSMVASDSGGCLGGGHGSDVLTYFVKCHAVQCSFDKSSDLAWSIHAYLCSCHVVP